jgi:hypothetical protein
VRRKAAKIRTFATKAYKRCGKAGVGAVGRAQSWCLAAIGLGSGRHGFHIRKKSFTLA